MINVGVSCLGFFFFRGQAKYGGKEKKRGSRGESVAGENTDITVLIKPSYLVAVRWLTGMTLCVSALK